MRKHVPLREAILVFAQSYPQPSFGVGSRVSLLLHCTHGMISLPSPMLKTWSQWGAPFSLLVVMMRSTLGWTAEARPWKNGQPSALHSHVQGRFNDRHAVMSGQKPEFLRRILPSSVVILAVGSSFRTFLKSIAIALMSSPWMPSCFLSDWPSARPCL